MEFLPIKNLEKGKNESITASPTLNDNANKYVAIL